MKASEALLLNSLLCGHHKGDYINWDNGNRCAIATIMLDKDFCLDIIVGIKSRYHMFSVTVGGNELYINEVISFNDSYGLSRPHIARIIAAWEQEYGEIGPQVPMRLLTHQGGLYDPSVQQHETVCDVPGIVTLDRVQYDIK